MSTLGKDVARGCGRAMTIRVIAALIVVPLGCLLIFLPLYLVTSLDFPVWVLGFSAVMFLVLLFGGGTGYVVFVMRRRKSMLDAAFASLGLEGGAYQTFFRQYHGTLRGRQVDVYLQRGPLLEIEIDTTLQTRLGVTGAHGDTRALAGLFGREPLPVDDPTLAGLTLFPHDEAWTRVLLADASAVAALQRLTATDTQFTRQQVVLRPGAFKLMLSGNRQLFDFQIAPEQVTQWLDDVFALARIAEGLPAPEVTAEMSSVEKLAEKVRQSNPYLALWIGLATVAVILALSVVIVTVVLILVAN